MTEQDVVNEEMYEEEDDNLPMQYRRLTAHLDTNSADFNRRLAAYLTNHVAMRSALNQAISNSYSGQSTNSQTFPQNTQTMQQPQWPQLAPQQSTGMVPPQMLHRPSNAHRHQPYPTPTSQGGSGSKVQSPLQTRKPSLHFASQSVDQSRRASTPASYPMSAPPTKTSPSLSPPNRPQSAASLPPVNASPAPEATERMSTLPPSISTPSTYYQSPGQVQFAYPGQQQSWGPSAQYTASPLTTTMPPETQMFFGGGNGFNTGYNASYSTNNAAKGQSQPFCASDLEDNKYSFPYINGMSQTLAPSAMENEQMSWPTPASGSDSEFSNANPFSYGQEFDDDFFTKPLFPGSSQLTPADNDWSSYINTSTWDDLGT